MRHVDPPKPPRGWQTNVLNKGRKWLNHSAKNRNAEDPAPYWRDYLPEIGEVFDYICCYTVVFVANGQADHFVPWRDVRGTKKAYQAYQWSNIRYADGWINGSKGAERFPDPFVVEDDWFELHLPSLELQATGKHPDDQQQAIDNLLKRVQKDPRVMNVRRRFLAQYRDGSRPIELVDRDMPLLGRALRKNPAFLLPADQARLRAGTL